MFEFCKYLQCIFLCIQIMAFSLNVVTILRHALNMKVHDSYFLRLPKPKVKISNVIIAKEMLPNIIIVKLNLITIDLTMCICRKRSNTNLRLRINVERAGKC